MYSNNIIYEFIQIYYITVYPCNISIRLTCPGFWLSGSDDFERALVGDKGIIVEIMIDENISQYKRLYDIICSSHNLPRYDLRVNCYMLYVSKMSETNSNGVIIYYSTSSSSSYYSTTSSTY
jgi:hypothetical protein